MGRKPPRALDGIQKGKIDIPGLDIEILYTD